MNKGTPYQSCLEPYEDEIIALRDRRRPVSCAKIAAYMKEKHQISITRQAIQKFLIIRAKGFKPCQYVESIKQSRTANSSTTELPAVAVKPKQTVAAVPEVSKQPASENPATSKTPEIVFKPFEMEFSETYNLTRMSPEEAAAKNKIIEEKIRAKYHLKK